MITCTYDGSHVAILRAVKLTNRLFSDPALRAAIAAHPRFDKTEATPAQIAEVIGQSEVVLTIATYKSKNPWSRVLGYVNEYEPNKIYLNTRRLDREDADIAGTIVHEAVHAADAASPLDFGHDGNRPGGNESSAPYWIGNWAIWKLKGAEGPMVASAHAADDEGQAWA